MLNEYTSQELPFDVIEAELLYGPSLQFHLEEECGFFRVGNTLLIQDGDVCRYFELEGQHQGMACGYLEALHAHEAGELPEDMAHLFEAREAAANPLAEALQEVLMDQYLQMSPMDMLMAAIMGDPIAMAIMLSMSSAGEEVGETPAADDGPPEAFASFFNM